MSYTQAQLNQALRVALEALQGDAQPKAHTTKGTAHATAKEDREAITSVVETDGDSFLAVTASGSGWAAPANCWSAEFKLGEFGVKVYHYGWTGTEDTITLTYDKLSALMTKKVDDFLYGADGKPRAGVQSKRGLAPTRDCAWRVGVMVRGK